MNRPHIRPDNAARVLNTSAIVLLLILAFFAAIQFVIGLVIG